jgi:hypothetical protein
MNAQMARGYVGATTDTGHKGSSGSFGMLKPGVPDVGLQTDFGWRSEHMMAVVSNHHLLFLLNFLILLTCTLPIFLIPSYLSHTSSGGTHQLEYLSNHLSPSVATECFRKDFCLSSRVFTYPCLPPLYPPTSQVSKQLIQVYYGKAPVFSYWNGCSTGGRQGQAMAQRFPDDYNGVLAGAPAIHFEKLGLGQTW